MPFKKQNASISFLIVLLFAIGYANGQGNPESPAPFYLDINKTGKTTVTDISTGMLGLQYMDVYGRTSGFV